ncbi:hypothetical protein [Kriegella aquimaris]|uniref:Entericidin EcnA/B family protein n=1 Tax=Kriegella aquimaris TaxID=192904 RepID=A0A1G9R9I3_9FLAO|nr:hypothetical protein [Kriegella aquimaris]SDM19926.1 hypothetical protein SAMN04488514_10643 [Kriegella aquimaris]
MKKLAYIFMFAFVTTTALSSCREDKSAGEKMEDGIEEVGDGIEEGAEEIKDEVDDAVDDN